MAWSWNKYRENHAQEPKPAPPPEAESPHEPATPPPEPWGGYPFPSEPDED